MHWVRRWRLLLALAVPSGIQMSVGAAAATGANSLPGRIARPCWALSAYVHEQVGLFTACQATHNY